MNWIKVVEKYKLAVIRYGNVMYNIMTIVNNTALSTRSLLREESRCSHHTHTYIHTHTHTHTHT